jgi:hypothetical protein
MEEIINMAESVSFKTDNYTDVQAFLSLPIDVIENELKTIYATLIRENGKYMIKFSDDSQLILFSDYQYYLKGIIFEKHIETGNATILSVSYSVPYDMSLAGPEVVHSVFQNSLNFSPKYKRVKTGTLLKLSYYDDNWHLSTNGVMNAYQSKFKGHASFGELFDRYFNVENYDYLNKEYTYVFILTTENLFHTGTIKTDSFIEIDDNININTFPDVTYEEFSVGIQSDIHNNYIMYYENNGYRNRFLFSINFENLLIDIARLATENFLDKQYDAQILEKKKELKQLINYIYNSYISFYIKKQKTHYPQHIWNVLYNIHNNVYLKTLKPQKQFITIGGIHGYFQYLSNSREIKYALNDFKILNTKV